MKNKFELPFNKTPMIKSYMQWLRPQGIVLSDEYSGKLNAVISEFSIKYHDLADDYFRSDRFLQNIENITFENDGNKLKVYSHPYEDDKYAYIYKKYRMENNAKITVNLKVDFLQNSHAIPQLKIIVSNGFNKESNQEINFANECSIALNSRGRIYHDEQSVKLDTNGINSDFYGNSVWLKLELQNNNFNSYYSVDGINWHVHASGDIKIDKDVEVGILIQPVSNPVHNIIFSNFIQLEHVVDPMIQNKLNYFIEYDEMIYSYNLPEQKIKIDLLDDLNVNYSLTDILIKLLQKEYYIFLHIDEYYLPNRTSYQRRHHGHRNIVYGFDSDNKTFKIAGYNRIPVFDDVKFEDLITAIENSPDLHVKLHNYEPSKRPITLNIDTIIYQLKEYANGTNSYERIAHLCANKPVYNMIYGILIYKNILDNEAEIENFIKDRRASYVVYEHKSAMLMRLEFLFYKRYLSKDEYEHYQTIWKNLCDTARLLNMLIIKNASKPGGNIEEKTHSMLQDIYDKEYCAVNELILSLEKNRHLYRPFST